MLFKNSSGKNNSGLTASSRQTASALSFSSIWLPTVQVCDATGDATTIKSWAQKKISLLITIIFFSANTFSQHNITITFKNVMGDKILNTDSVYTNQFAETFSVRNFRYYISNIALHDSINNKSQSFAEYFLIDEKVDTSKIITLTSPLKQITCIEFLLGIDSIKNVSGVQTGVLDPAKGMFWTWNTGYVMVKLEGISPDAKTPAHTFSYHVGGYKKGEAVVKKIKLAIPNTVTVNKNDQQIFITADILKWFSGKHDIKISDTPFCHEPGKLAMQIADNYAAMFNLEPAQ